MIVLSDTTPLRYLIDIDEIHVLEKLFGEVIIPEKVDEELQRPKTPQKIKNWMQARPPWLKVRKADVFLLVPVRNWRWQREGIMALELKADVVLMDDKDAAAEAQRHHILTVPTFAILEQAAARSLHDLPRTMDAMLKTSFRLPPEEIIEAMLKRDLQRKESEP